jgi:hypothetical protein
MEAAEGRWRKLTGAHLVALVSTIVVDHPGRTRAVCSDDTWPVPDVGDAILTTKVLSRLAQAFPTPVSTTVDAPRVPSAVTEPTPSLELRQSG